MEKLLFTPGMELKCDTKVELYDGSIGCVKENTPHNITYKNVIIYLENYPNVTTTIDKQLIRYIL